MNPEVLSLLSDVQFVLAQVLWDPRCDRSRALQIAALAAKSHPDPDRSAAIAGWLQLHAAPAVEDVAIEHLRESLRSASEEAVTRRVPRFDMSELADAIDREDASRSSPYLDFQITWPATASDPTRPFARV